METKPGLNQQSDEPNRSKVCGPCIFWGVVAGKGLFFAWVATCGLLWFDTDSDWVKQAALVKLTNGRFATPMAEGNIPHAALVYHWYPFYPLVLATYLRLAGTSHAAHIWFDLGLNAMAAAVAAWWLMRRTRQGWLAALYLLGTPFLATFKLGRRETLTSLCVMLAAMLTMSRRRPLFWLVGCFLGCAVAASYPAGLACCAAWAAFVLSEEETLATKVARILRTGLVAMVSALAIWLCVVYPYWREALEALSCNIHKLGESYGRLLLGFPANPRLALPLTVAVGTLSWAYSRQRRLPGGQDDDDLRLVRGAFWAAFGYLGMLFGILRRPAIYYFPPLAHLVFPLAVYLFWRLMRETTSLRWMLPARALAAIAVSLVLAWLNAFLLRAALLPLGWTDDSMTPAKVKALLEDSVPRTATLGGDGKLLTIVATNWNWISLNWTGTSNWPQYMVSPVHPRTLEPTLFGFKGFGPRARERLQREYEPVATMPAEPSPCEFTRRLRGWGLPMPEYRTCDWFVRIWKRRDARPGRAI